jgi:hypothetical protein
MKKINFILSIIILIGVFGIVTAQAQPRPRQNGSERNNSSNVGSDKLPDDSVKRTWEFFRRLGGVPRSSGGSLGTPTCDKAIKDFNENVENFNNWVNEFLSGAQDPKKMKLEKRKINSNVKRAISEIADYEDIYLKIGQKGEDQALAELGFDVCNGKITALQFQGIKTYLVAAKKLYSDDPDVDSGLSMVEEAIKKIGSEKDILAHVEKNRTGSIAKVRLPAPLSKNPAWEKMFKDYFVRSYSGYTYIKQSLYSSEWYVKKNELTSIPEYRQIGTRIAAKTPDGKCKLIKLDIFQNYVGNSFDSGKFMKGGEQDILCENLK